ncbi:uncharacterized protein AMSG_08776 [Thecamonas trahens ATCC 50062]|uniref:Uncharacterized protein n=1 Tax=Thecamonas trahens ATCC 50062 TaxID=461836 RepID=A0A0L0DPD1_THETB|nr:hypothetical protein AMSG_08776 [Thecamonas trahens ATCC 50062]KNC53283.1 hypothetical protein AMSG_08776 [Thecamonas trahens ATCC 50062]|eukprot:XP_013754547.1 hypothetical protein AMSG_08776 [Thecamonas trahens ATCC 50062]
MLCRMGSSPWSRSSLSVASTSAAPTRSSPCTPVVSWRPRSQPPARLPTTSCDSSSPAHSAKQQMAADAKLLPCVTDSMARATIDGAIDGHGCGGGALWTGTWPVADGRIDGRGGRGRTTSSGPVMSAMLRRE